MQQIACECVASLTLKLINSRPLESMTLALVNLVSTTKEEMAKRKQISDRLVGLKEKGAFGGRGRGSGVGEGRAML